MDERHVRANPWFTPMAACSCGDCRWRVACDHGGHTSSAASPPLPRHLHPIANVIRGSGQAAVDFQGCNACVAANNTILDPGRWVVRILPGSRDTSTVTSQAGVFINNVVVYDAADVSVITNVGPNTQPATFTFGNNLGSHGSGVPAETNSILQQNPNLATDQKPAAGSPVIGRGRALPTGVAAFDFTRQAVSTPPDLGAHRAP